MWYGRKGVRYFLQKEYEVIFELSDKFFVLSLCNEININRSGFYKWLNRRINPSIKEINRNAAYMLFDEYHSKYPSHGYRWLNIKVKDLGVVYSDNFTHKICKFLGIKSEAKHVKRYGKNVNRELKNFPNYILAHLNHLRPFQLVVSDMTTFWSNNHYYELTLFMDLFNNEILYLTKRCPFYISHRFIFCFTKKEEDKDLEMILHSNQGSVYSSKKFNDSLYLYNIIHSMSKPVNLPKMVQWNLSIGRSKKNCLLILTLILLTKFFLKLTNYIHYFNYERLQSALNYLTPIQFKNLNYIK